MKGFKNVNIYVQDKGVINTSLGFNEDKISFIGEGEIEEVISLPENAVVLPGFIDQHIHGSATADTMDGTVDAISTMANSIASEGTVAFLATSMTQSNENISKAMISVKNYLDKGLDTGAELLGVHLEGPYINTEKAGAQPAEYIVNPSIEEFAHYNKLSGNNIRIVTLAPEKQNSDEFIKYLVANDIRASIGHTSAKFADVEKALALGASQITHTYNAQTPLAHREVGVVGAAYLLDDLACEIICDLIHISIPALKLLFKNKPNDKVILITDAMRAKNLGDTVSELGGQTVYVKNGEARLANGALAGSVLKLNDAVKNIINTCGVDFCTAVDYATANPAKNLGIFDRLGSISVGKDASFAIVNKNTFEVLYTIRKGKIIYKK